MRHVNQEAVKRMRTGSNFGLSPTAVVTNTGDRSDAPRPRHCTSFPPFTFSNTRFERSMSQNGSSIESLFTLPSERSIDIRMTNPNSNNKEKNLSQFRNQMEGVLTVAQVEGTPNANLANPNGIRVKRSLSDNGTQMEGSSRALLMQRSPNTSLLKPSLTRVRRSFSQEQTEMEGVYTLSSMDMLPVTNLENPNSSRSDRSATDTNSANPNTRSTNPSTECSNPYTSRFRNLLRSQSQMEGTLSMSPMDKRLFLETALANAANIKANEIDENKTEGVPGVSSTERSANVTTTNCDTNKGEWSIYQKENQMDGILSQSSAERPCEANSANLNENEENRTLSKSQTQMESTLSLSSLERSPDKSTANPILNEEDGKMFENQAEMEAALSLSSKMSSDKNLASHKESSLGIELSLSSVERSHNTKGVNKSLPQGPAETDGALSLTSMERSTDARVTKSDSRREMASILTLASIESLGNTNLENPNTTRGEQSLSLNVNQMEASLSLSSMERSCDTNLEKANADGAEKSLVLQPGQMKDCLRTEKRSPEINLANPRLVNNADRSSIENQGEMDGALSLPSMEKMSDTIPSTQHHGQGLPSIERSEAQLREQNLSQVESTSQSSMERLPNANTVQPNANAQQNGGILLELNLPPRSPMFPTEQQPPPPPLSPPPPPPPPPPPHSPPPLPPPPPMPQPSGESQKSNEEIAQLEATVAELRSKLEHSKEEAVTTKEKVTTLEAEISAIKAATEDWQRVMAEEASRRVAEAVSQFTSALHAGPSEAFRRTEILFPGAEDDDTVVEVPSLLSQLEKNK